MVKSVPALVCAVCGEEYVDEETTRHVTALADAAARSGVELEVREFAAA